MIDHAASRLLVSATLSKMPVAFPGDAWLILDEHTRERSWGWVFFWDSCKYQDSGNIRFAVIGNSPFFVRRTDGAVFDTGTALPVEHYIADFESAGNLVRRCD